MKNTVDEAETEAKRKKEKKKERDSGIVSNNFYYYLDINSPETDTCLRLFDSSVQYHTGHNQIKGISWDVETAPVSKVEQHNRH